MRTEYDEMDIEWIEAIARRTCHTRRGEVEYNGEMENNVTDSGGMGDDAHYLRVLSDHGRFRIIRQFGRMVVGYWPENDPERKTT